MAAAPVLDLSEDFIYDHPVFRIDHRLVEHEPVEAEEGISQHGLSRHQYTVLFWYKCCFKDTTLLECAEFLRIVCNVTVSRSTVCRALLRLGFKKKHMKYIAKYLDENDRVAFWVNPPDHSLRPGVLGVYYRDIVDLDESGFYVSNSRRVCGHSLGSTSSSSIGNKARMLPHYSLLVAIDARKGVINNIFYPHGTTSEVFYHFVVYLLIPSLEGTGRRVITMDRLSAHFGVVVKALTDAGHYVVFRPASSPTFAPVEWVFSYVDKFLQEHSPQVTPNSLKFWLRTALDTISRFDVKQYMAAAHFYVPTYPYTPYRGEQS